MLETARAAAPRRGTFVGESSGGSSLVADAGAAGSEVAFAPPVSAPAFGRLEVVVASGGWLERAVRAEAELAGAGLVGADLAGAALAGAGLVGAGLVGAGRVEVGLAVAVAAGGSDGVALVGVAVDADDSAAAGALPASADPLTSLPGTGEPLPRSRKKSHHAWSTLLGSS
jgi:hypothetical protein